MPFALHLDIFDPEVAVRNGQPYELQWSVNQATAEQMDTAVKLLAVLGRKIAEVRLDRFPEEV